MKFSPSDADWLELDEVDSTQSEAARRLRKKGLLPKVFLAMHQTEGRGRFGRTWISEPGASLAMSIVLEEYAGHPRPWLPGMALACAAASVLHCRLRWPNDLYLDGKKLGGILTEIVEGVPVIGIGANLNQTSFPDELQGSAISLALHRSGTYDPKELARKIVRQFASEPEANDWADIAPIWDLFDDTPGKRFKLPEGGEGVALGIGPHGELLCSVDGESRSVLAAEAILG